jgi:ribose transport system ATP-binding protein
MQSDLKNGPELGANADSPAFLVVSGLAKAYGQTQALVSVDMTLRSGSVHGLVGENGAGKSTLVRILSGISTPDAGQIAIDGVPVDFANPEAARLAGISTVFQELTLIPDLSVAENVALQSRGSWTPGRRARSRQLNGLMQRWGLGATDPDVMVGALSLRDRQILEIVCAVDRPHRLLILDEPTSALLPEDTSWLHAVTRRLTERGGAVMFISHMLDEVEDFCDEVSVQRNGSIIASHKSPGFDRKLLVEQMIGRSLTSAFPSRSPAPTTDQVALRIRSLTVGNVVRGVDLDVRPGEIVGVAALDGQGQETFFAALAGAVRASSGTVAVNGHRVRLRSPKQAIRAGIAYVPGDRKVSGTVLGMSIRKNISLPILGRLSRAGVMDDRREGSRVIDLMELVQLDPPRIDHLVRSLSGGNQQKVSFARAFASKSPTLLLYDPTRGVDVGTKFELYKLIQEEAASGTAVLLYSTEIPEIVNLSHRALAWYGGRIVKEFTGPDLSEAELMGAAIGLEAQE